MTEADINFIHSQFQENFNLFSRDLQKIPMLPENTASLTTVRKAINVAGFASSKLRYCQVIREVNKVIRANLAHELFKHSRVHFMCNCT